MRECFRRTACGLFAGVVCFGLGAAEAPKDGLFRIDEPEMGVTVLPASRNRWKGHALSVTRPLTDADRRVHADLDFFTLEYGRPEPPRELVVTGSTASVHWGAVARESATPGIRLGRGWGAFGCDRFCLELDLEQNVDVTEWTFTRHLTKMQMPRNFSVKGRARQIFRLDLDLITPRVIETCGLDLACRTPGARVKLHAIRLMPQTQRVYWRRRFTASEKPFRAGISFGYSPRYELKVNGRTLDRGRGMRIEGVIRREITDAVRAGENEIVICSSAGTSQRVEAFWADAQGHTTRLGGDTEWEWSLDGRAWTAVRDGGPIGLGQLPNGTPMADGTFPLHAGVLSVRPSGRPYPVFDAGAEIAWDARFPIGLADAKLTARVCAAETGATQAVVSVLAPGCVKLPDLPGGAYDVFWELASGAAVLETDRTELVVAGRLDLGTYALTDFEAEFAKRKRLVQTVDCTQPAGPRDFIDSGSLISKPEMNVGRVGEEKGLRFRETGEASGSFFSYRLDIAALGQPHVIEVDYPDTREQTLYVEINEAFPVPFCLNGYPLGSRGWPNASGAVCCGRTQPLTNKKKTLSVVFFPGARAITVAFQKGDLGGRAAVCGFRVYAVEGGLPALRVPKSTRLYANHNERLLFRDWGAAINPRSKEPGRDLHEDYWKSAYLSAVNRIQYLKFAGHNASIEGAYMYSFEFPTRSGASESVFDEYDPLYLVAKMYRHNDISTFIGFEYISAPNLYFDGRRDVSDRDVRERGADTIEYVDRYGRQPLHSLAPGLNGMHPTVRASITGLLGEIYARYAGCGVKGLFVVGGGWWLPGYPYHTQDDPLDIGYGDLDISLFERETGCRVKADRTGTDRFAQRFDDLTGRLREKWLAWRSAKTKELADEMARTVRMNPDEPWRFQLISEVDLPRITPFDRLDATEEERAAFYGSRLSAASFEPSLYDAAPTAGVEWIPYMGIGKELDLRHRGMMFNRGVLDLVRRQDAIYLAADGLNERASGVRGTQPWWWRRDGIVVYDTKDSDAFAFAPEVDLLAEHTPSVLIHAWLDVNVPTAHSEASRRFLTGYYATPSGKGRPFAAVHGVTARLFGDSAVQLVNATPYPVAGRLTASRGVVSDALTGAAFTGTFDYTLGPYGVTVLTLAEAEKTLSGEFRFADEVTREIEALWRKTGEDVRGSVYDRARELRGYELASRLERLAAGADKLENQKRFLARLAAEGAVRIDCGSAKDLTDEKGRVWLADQRYVGVPAYGNEFKANYTDRGDIEIANTDIPSVYRTEACSAKVRYHLPVPDGRYRVRVLFADTYSRAPGLKQTFSIGADIRTIDIWKETGGRCHAGAVTFEGVSPVAGEILVEMTGGTVFNGLELERL